MVHRDCKANYRNDCLTPLSSSVSGFMCYVFYLFNLLSLARLSIAAINMCVVPGNVLFAYVDKQKNIFEVN